MASTPREALDQATVAHALWKTRLRDAAQGRMGAIDPRVARDCHACAFGKWLDGGADGMSHDPECAVVVQLHESFHQLVGIFLDRVARGISTELDTPLVEGHSIRSRSSRLALEILRWRDRLGP